MPIVFRSRSSASVTLPNEVGLKMISMMGHRLTIPGTLLAQEVPHARSLLISSLDKESKLNKAPFLQASSKGRLISKERTNIHSQALALVNLLDCAIGDSWDVMWDSQ